VKKNTVKILQGDSVKYVTEDRIYFTIDTGISAVHGEMKLNQKKLNCHGRKTDRNRYPEV
jgi:hypothetical protein